MGDHGTACNFDDATEFSTTNENEIKGDTSSSPQTVSKNNTSGSRQLSRKKQNKKVHNANDNRKGTPYFIPTKPQEFVGFYVCKEHNGARILGTVTSHNRKNNLLKVEYEDNSIEHLKQDDVQKLAATKRDIVEAQQLLKRNNTEKASDGKAKRPSSSEESTARNKKGNISTGANI